MEKERNDVLQKQYKFCMKNCIKMNKSFTKEKGNKL